MRRQIWLAGILGLAAACGGKDESKPEDAPEAVAAAQAQAKRDAAEAKRVAAEREQQRRAKAEELARRKEELTAKVKQLEAALAEMDKRQAAELEGIADPRELRPYLQRLMRDSNTESARLQSMERRLAKLEKTMAKAKVSGELKALQDRMATVEASYWKAHSGWMASLENKRFGVQEESPVKRELDMLRAIRHQWLRATPMARRGPVGGREKKIINEGFRAWLNELPSRKQVVTTILTQPKGPKSTPDRYDFTELDFYLLLSIQELEFEKRNIVEEKKDLDENLVKLQAIEKEMDALREKIAEKLTEGGGDLELYQDLKSRLPEQRTKAADLRRRSEELKADFFEIDKIKNRQLEEQDAAARALEAAQKELKLLRTKLRR